MRSSIGRHDAAATHFTKALSLEPRFGPIYIDYANFLFARGDQEGAREAYLTAAKLMPNDPSPLFQLGVMEQKLGELAAAETHFRKILETDQHGPSFNHLAVILASKAMPKEAADLLRQAVKAEPENAEYHNNLGVMLVRANEHQEALKALEEAIRINPNYAEARKNLDDLRLLISSMEKR